VRRSTTSVRGTNRTTSDIRSSTLTGEDRMSIIRCLRTAFDALGHSAAWTYGAFHHEKSCLNVAPISSSAQST
jgi:hypothetical protein